MSTTINKIGAFIIGAATLLPVPRTHEAHAQTPADNTLKAASSEKVTNDKQFSEEYKQHIRDNYFHSSAAGAARDPRFRVEQKDIDFAMKDFAKTSPFALGLTQNPTFPITEANIKFARENPTSSFAIGLVQNERYSIQQEDVTIARKNIDSAFAYYVTKNPAYKIERKDKEIAWESPRSRFATGLSENENYAPEKKDKETARKDPSSNYAASIAKNKTYRVEDEDIKTARKHLDTEFAYQIVQKPDYKVTQEDIELARNNINSYFAQIAINPNYLKGRSEADIQKDISIALENPDSIFAAELFSNPALKLTKEHIEIVKKESMIDTQLAEAIAQNPKYPVTEENIQLALDNPNSWYSAGLAQNPAFPLAKYWKHIKENFNTRLAFGYAQNPKLEITNEVYFFAHTTGDSPLIAGLFQHPEYNNAEKRIHNEIVKEILGLKNNVGETSNVTDATFNIDVKEATQPVLVYFHAPWCGACKQMSPRITELAKIYGGGLKVLKLNTDNNPKSTEAYNVQSLPKLVLFKDGNTTELEGWTKSELVAEINKQLNLK
ncbi:MAG: conjugal transfer protein TraF [Candidatus Melainabacteria bacterium]|nr:conjugal transfer protein TraF [Candidatus Melainabacteria bacterium]